MFPATLTWLLSDHHYIYRIVEGMQPNVLLLFIICMVMAVVGRVRRVYRVSESNAAELLIKNKELEQFHRNLEQLVETRTAELERANQTLAMTMREKAETLAEMSVLEERNRIAYEMHDVVGHTLTAAIVSWKQPANWPIARARYLRRSWSCWTNWYAKGWPTSAKRSD